MQVNTFKNSKNTTITTAYEKYTPCHLVELPQVCVALIEVRQVEFKPSLNNISHAIRGRI
jgi:hypothetical protein